MNTRIINLAITIVFLLSCNESKQNNNADNSPKVEQGKPAISLTNFELLQGKWQSTDDKTNFLSFEKDHRKEISAGMNQWDDEVFILADKCLNDSNKEDNVESEKDRYITCKESDLCWYIIELNENTLSLSYMGRGNTLSYKKAK